MGEVSRDWLKDVGGWDRIVVFQEPLIQLLDAFTVFGEFRQKNFKLLLRDEARKSSDAVPVPQQRLWSPDVGKQIEEEELKDDITTCFNMSSNRNV